MTVAVDHWPLVAGVTLINDVDGLSAIRDPDCAAVLWRRLAPVGMVDWLHRLDPDQLPRARMILRPEAVPGAIGPVCDASGTPGGPEREAFAADVAMLAARFAQVMRARWLRLRLDVVTTDACRRFHRDAVTARLVCTYRGTGTQFGVAADGGMPDRIDTAPTCAPILLRGTLWPVTQSPGLLHRSPPIAGTGETRLLLVLDPVDDPEDAV